MRCILQAEADLRASGPDVVRPFVVTLEAVIVKLIETDNVALRGVAHVDTMWTLVVTLHSTSVNFSPPSSSQNMVGGVTLEWRVPRPVAVNSSC